MTLSGQALRNGVTIGIPLYNEEKYIAAAIRTAASQCEVVIVSDNASTDGSAVICEAMRREHPNIVFERQPSNLGASLNFKYVLDRATTPYFMWLGGHDLLPDGYVEILSKLLRSNADAVMAYGASQHIDADGAFTKKYEYTFAATLADRSPLVRTLALIRHLEDCSLLHGIFRTDVLRAACAASGQRRYLGSDHVLLGHAALKGIFLYDPTTSLVRRDPHAADTIQDQLKRINGQTSRDRTAGEQQSPHCTMQRELFALAAGLSQRVGMAGLMFRLRARYHLVGRYGSFGETLVDRQLDRLLQRRLVSASMNRLNRILT